VVEHVDVRDAHGLGELPSLALSHFGRLDFLVANAGIHDTSSIDSGDFERWRAVIETNLLGAMFTVRAVVPTMIEQGSGDIVLMASISGREVYVGAPAYLASKWGLVGFGYTLRKEVTPHGLRVTLVEPGMVDTPLARDDPAIRPLLEAAEPLQAEDVARLVVYACNQPPHVVLSELAIRPQHQPDVTAVGTANDAPRD
jgi:NADP-dependent 3-hydroxy acid dehydrogenase YdfG